MAQNHNEKMRKKSSIKIRNMLGMGDQEPPPIQNEEEYPEDTDTPNVLPILQRGQFSKQTKAADSMSETQGRLKYAETMDLLTCKICDQLVSIPFIQCRKGHLYCRECKHDNKVVQCKICKQTFVEAPNIALDQLISFIAVPCKYSERGCDEFVFVSSRLQHETLCRHRPVHCKYQERGCTQEHSVKDMCWHVKMCQYATYPYPNVLPTIPPKKQKGAAANGSIPHQRQNGGGVDHTE